METKKFCLTEKQMPTQYLSAISRIVQHKILVQGTVSIITPVMKKIITKEFFFTSGCFQETCRNNLVGMRIFPKTLCSVL